VVEDGAAGAGGTPLMGLEIEREEFADEEHRRVAERLRASLAVLELIGPA